MKITIFKDCLLQQARRHPALGPQDAVKLSYQASHGAEHLLRDRDGVHHYFSEEYHSVPAADLPLYEPICADFARVNLAAWKYHDLPEQWLFEMFYLTAGLGAQIPGLDDRAETLRQYLDAVGDLSAAGQLPFDLAAWQAFRQNYEEAGGGAIHHSATYREAEYPAYRIIHRQYLRLIPLLESLAEKLSHMPASDAPALVLAIDGQAASGKTTVAAHLSAILGASVIHMDDFFLPPALRYPQRLAETGGNIHYERFIQEILPQIHQPEAFTYQVFDCSIMELSGEQTIPAGPIRIVEGSYSHHPKFAEYPDIRIFCHLDPQTQQERILHRNGPEMLERFLTEWIPMEEQYFAGFQIQEQADFILE